MEIKVQQLDTKIFCKKVEDIVNNGESYINSVVMACDHFGISPEFGAKFISKPIIEKIQKEGEKENLLPKKSKLPI